MKTGIIFLLLLTSAKLYSQQNNFLEPPANSHYFSAPVFGQTFHEIFEYPECTSATIYAEELDSVSFYDFSKLKKLELLSIRFTLSPDSSDEFRKIFRDSIQILMKNLSAFSKCPKLKRIVFSIGEQAYLTHAESDVPNAYDDDVRGKLFEKNVTNAWISFGKDVHAILPRVKLYAYTWGW
jgi:hypothetical protein